jgi:hypothetical protein
VGEQASSMWPVPLQPYARGDVLRFRSNGPHPFAWFAVPFGLALGLMGAIGIVGEPGVLSFVVGGATIAFGVAVLYSTAFGAWGELELSHVGTSWTVTTRLGRRERSSGFPQRDVRSVEIYTPPPYNIVWPGAAGRQLRIELDRRERPLFLGAGLQLPPEVLQCLHDMFAAGESSSP